MATELGQAYVQIMPSAKGISGSIQKVLDPEVSTAGKKAGGTLAEEISKSMGMVGKTLTKAITVPALGAATAVSGIISTLGFKRLVGIDTAQAKLKGLGHDAKTVEKIMNSALESVKGTAFGMDEAATTAASAVAAGIKPGKELTRYLTLTGDAAAIAGVSMAEMGSIINQVQTSQVAYTDNLNQLADRGIPIYQWLGEEAGVAASEVKKMASEGKISSEMFLNAIEKNIGGAAKTMGEESFVAGFKNVFAAIGRIGAQFLDAGGKGGGFFSTIKPLFSEAIGYIDSFSDKAADLGVKFGEAFTKIVENIKNAIQWWTNLDGSTKNLIMTIAGIAVAIGPVLMVISKTIGTISTLTKGLTALKGGFMAAKAGEVVASGAMAKLGGVMATLLGPIGLIVGAIAGLVALFVALYKKNEGFRDLVQTVWSKIKETISSVIQVVSDFVMQVWGSLVEWWNANGEMIMQAAQNVWNVISTVITTVMNIIWNIMQALWPIIQALIVSTWEAIKGVIQGAINVITGIIQFFSALFTGNWSALWDSVKQIVTGAVQLVWNLVQLWFVGKILKLGEALFTGLRGIVTNIWNTVKSIFTSGVNTAMNVVSSGFNFIRSIISSVMNAILSVISSIWNGIRSTISSVANGIKSTISGVFNSLSSIVSGAFNGVRSAVSSGMTSAYNAVKNFFGEFKQAGINIVTSIADGINSAIGKVTSAMKGIAQKIRNFLPFSPPKEGPLTDIMEVKWGETIGAGILKGENKIARAMDEVLSFDLTKKATFNNPYVRENEPTQNYMQQNQPIILQIDGKTFAQIIGDYTNMEGGNRIRRIERGLAT